MGRISTFEIHNYEFLCSHWVEIGFSRAAAHQHIANQVSQKIAPKRDNGGTKGVLLGLVLEKSLYSGSSGYCGYWDRVHTTGKSTYAFAKLNAKMRF